MTDQVHSEAEMVDRLATVFLKLPGARRRRSRARQHALSIQSLHRRKPSDAASRNSRAPGASADQQAADQIKKLRHSLKWLSDDLANLGARAQDEIERARGDLEGHQLHLSYLPMVLTAVTGDLDPALDRAETRLRAGAGENRNSLASRDPDVGHALEIGWRARHAYFDLTGVLASRTEIARGSFHPCLKEIFEVLGIEVDSALIMRMLFSGKSRPPAEENSAMARRRQAGGR